MSLEHSCSLYTFLYPQIFNTDLKQTFWYTLCVNNVNSLIEIAFPSHFSVLHMLLETLSFVKSSMFVQNYDFFFLLDTVFYIDLSKKSVKCSVYAWKSIGPKPQQI